MLLIRCESIRRFIEDQTSWAMLYGHFVRPRPSPAGSTEYAEIEDADFPYSELPKGPLELVEYPAVGVPRFTVRRYRSGSSLGGPVFICLFLPDCGLDDSTFLGKVYTFREVAGEGGLEPLL